MKIYDTRRSNGRLLPFKVRDQHVWYTTGNMPYPDALAKIQKTVNKFKNTPSRSSFYTNYQVSLQMGRNYKKYDLVQQDNTPNTLVKENGTFYIKTQKADNKFYPPKPKSHYWRQLDYNNRGRCVIVDDGRNISSDYGYTYDDISNMIKNDDYHEYIQDGDYLLLTVRDYIYTMRFNINTYYDYSYKNPYANSEYLIQSNIPHHIDMLSDEVFAVPQNYLRGYFSDELIYEYMEGNYVESGGATRLRKSTSISEIHDNPDGNLFYFLNDKFYKSVEPQLSDMLKKHIKPKLAKGYNMTITYTPGIVKTSPNFDRANTIAKDVSLGLLWQLSEAEIYGHTIHGFQSDVTSDIQYPTCRIYGAQKPYPVRKDMDIKRRLGEYRWYTTSTMAANIARNGYDFGTVRVAGNGVSYTKNVGEITDGSTFGKDMHYTLNFRFM